VRVDHYMLLNFAAFEKIIDALGGISVPITPEEIKFLCDTTRLGRQIGRKSMEEQMAKKGKVDLKGIQALIYVRIRKVPGQDDRHRAERQRSMVDAIVAKIKARPWRLFAVASKALPEVKTDMGRLQAAALAALAPYYYAFSVEGEQIPAKGWNYGTKNGQSVITMDFDANKKRLREFIYE